MQNFVKIGHNRCHFFLNFKTASVRNLGFLSFQIFGCRSVETINVHRYTNFIKVGQMVAEIQHLTIFTMVAIVDF